MRVIGVDASSDCVGWVIYDTNERLPLHSWGVVKLGSGAIGERCVEAFDFFSQLSTDKQPDALAIEAPVGQFKGSLIPQAQVNGAILTAAEKRQILTFAVSPKEAKLALTRNGSADKVMMLKWAIYIMGYSPDAFTYKKVNGSWGAYDRGELFLTEHESDAFGVVIAGKEKVSVTD